MATIITIIFGIKYWYIVVGVFVLIITLMIIGSVRRKKRRAAYLAQPVVLYGVTTSKTYHRKDCRTLANVSKDHMVFSRESDNPERAGYRPCGTCKPPRTFQ